MPVKPDVVDLADEPELGTLQVGLAASAGLRWASVELAGPLRVACRRLGLGPLATAALGRCLSGAALLSRMSVKIPSRFVLELHGDGPLRKVLAEVSPPGRIRGMVSEPLADLPALGNGDLDLGGAIGSGQLRVWRQGKRTSYQSHVELEAGSVGQALTHYLHQSEQRRSAVLLGVLMTPRGVASAGGLLVEVLPGAGEEVIDRLENNVGEISSTGRLLASDGPAGLRAAVLADLESIESESAPLAYVCPCRRRRIGRFLAGLPTADLEELTTLAGDIETQCVFCGARYRFEPKELEASSTAEDASSDLRAGA